MIRLPMEIYLKVYERGTDLLVASCDCDIAGKTFTEGDLYIEVSPGFYGSEKAGIEDLYSALSEATIANLVGNRLIETLIDAGYIDEDKVIEIQGVKHAQMIRM